MNIKISKIINVLEKTRNKKKMYITDLILPPFIEDGSMKPTTTQLIVISRLIDIELNINRRDFYWIYKGKNKGSNADNKTSFILLIDLLKKNGIIDKQTDFSINTYPYVSFVHGTHRLGYILFSKEHYWIEVLERYKYRKPFYSLNGLTFFKDQGYTNNEINILYNKYNEVLKDLDAYYLCIVLENKFKEFEEKCLDFDGLLAKKKGIVKINKKTKKYHQYKKFVQFNNKKVYILKYRICSQQLVLKKREFIAKSVIILNNRMKQYKNWGYVSKSISDAKMLELFIDEYVTVN